MSQGRAVTSEQMERFLNGLRLGMTRRAACGAAGFSKSSLYRMLDADDGTLGTSIEMCEAEAEAAHTAAVAKAAADPKNWTASAWWLERRHPEDYGRKDRVEVKIDLRSIAEKVAPGLNVDEVLAEAERIMSEAK